VLRRIADYIAEHPGKFPAVDPRRNALNQLYLLDGGQLRGIARAIYEKSL
jgi:hypothetical protein